MAFIDVIPLPSRLANLLAHARPTPQGQEQGGPGGYEIRNAAGGGDADAELILYSEIGGWFGATDAEFAEALSGITAKRLTVRLNSPGGSVFQGIAIANLLRSHTAYVTVSVDGLAASIASVIAIAGDEVVAQPNSQFMVHKASGLCLGNDDDMEEMRDLLRRQSENIARAYAARIPGSRWDTWYNRMAQESWYSAEEAVAVGLADRVAQYPKKSKPAEDEPDNDGEDAPDMATAAKATPRIWDLSVFRYAGRDAAPDPMAEPPQANADRPPPPGESGVTPPDDGKAAPPPPAGGSGVTPPRVEGAHGPQPVFASANTFPPDFVDQLREAVRDEFKAAGIGAATPADTAVGPHDGTARDGTWDADTQLKHLSWPIPVATARRVFAWYDGARVEDGKVPRDACSLPHHFISEDGTPGAPSRSGITAALGRLDQTHGPTDAEKDTIRRHLRGHLPSDDGDDKAQTTPPEQPAEPVRVFAFGRPRPDDRPLTLAFGKGGQRQ